MQKQAGALMRAEISEAPARFIAMIERDLQKLDVTALLEARAIYTIARGSSDAAANILAYEMMQVLGKPVTSLPPSVFSLGAGVDMRGAVGLVISQSGASRDLVQACQGVQDHGGTGIVLTNTETSPASQIADLSIDIEAGPELAIPATKSVIATLAAGMALLGRLAPHYQPSCKQAAEQMRVASTLPPALDGALIAALQTGDPVYIIGRGAGFGAAQELALKFKECAALHAEAYSASEVLHGPLQLATKPLNAIILDTQDPEIQPSLDIAATRLSEASARVFRLSPADFGVPEARGASAAAILLYALYPLVHDLTLALGMDPDTPETLAKITDTV